MANRILLLLMALLCSVGIYCQELPQFTNSDFDGWSYNNPNVPLSSTNIAGGKIKLYIDKNGLVLTLTSPEFACQGIDSINANVAWYMKAVNDGNFDLAKTALTMAIDDETGTPLDSVTVLPPAEVSPTLTLSLPVPAGVEVARLRFVSWQADVVSSGAIKRALLTAVTSSHQDDDPDGDADGNGTFNISDVTLAIQYILNGHADINLAAADMDRSGEVNISDIIQMIQKLLYN